MRISASWLADTLRWWRNEGGCDARAAHDGARCAEDSQDLARGVAGSAGEELALDDTNSYEVAKCVEVAMLQVKILINVSS